jgi:hypothetical protein
MGIEARPIVMRINIVGVDFEAFRNGRLGGLTTRRFAILLLMVADGPLRSLVFVAP